MDFSAFTTPIRLALILWTVLLFLNGGFRFYWAARLNNTTYSTTEQVYTNPMAFMTEAELRSYLKVDVVQIVKSPTDILIVYMRKPDTTDKIDESFIKQFFADTDGKPTTGDDFSGDDESSGTNLASVPIPKAGDKINLIDDITADYSRIILRPKYVVSNHTCELEKYKMPFFLTGCVHLAVAYVLLIVCDMKDVSLPVYRSGMILLFIYVYFCVGLIGDMAIDNYFKSVVVCPQTSPFIKQFHISMEMSAFLLLASSFIFVCVWAYISIKKCLAPKPRPSQPLADIIVVELEPATPSVVVIEIGNDLLDSTDV